MSPQLESPLDLSRLISGDEAEWAQFCKSQSRLILAAGHRVGLRPIEKEDLVQNTCIICYGSIHRLRDLSRLGGWVYRIAYRQALRLVDNRLPESDSGDDGDADSLLDRTADPGESIQEVLERHETNEQIWRQLNLLGAQCRELLQLLYLKTTVPAYEEISRSLEMPIGSIGPTRARCLDRLRSKMKSVSSDRRSGTSL